MVGIVVDVGTIIDMQSDNMLMSGKDENSYEHEKTKFHTGRITVALCCLYELWR